MRYQYQFLMDNGNSVVVRCINPVNGYLFSVNKNLALFCDVDAAQNLNQRGFTCPVFTEQCVDLAGPQFQVHPLKRLDSRK